MTHWRLPPRRTFFCFLSCICSLFSASRVPASAVAHCLSSSRLGSSVLPCPGLSAAVGSNRPDRLNHLYRLAPPRHGRQEKRALLQRARSAMSSLGRMLVVRTARRNIHNRGTRCTRLPSDLVDAKPADQRLGHPCGLPRLGGPPPWTAAAPTPAQPPSPRPAAARTTASTARRGGRSSAATRGRRARPPPPTQPCAIDDVG